MYNSYPQNNRIPIIFLFEIRLQFRDSRDFTSQYQRFYERGNVKVQLRKTKKIGETS